MDGVDTDESSTSSTIARFAADACRGFTDAERARFEEVAGRAVRRMEAGEPKDHVVRARAAKERAAADEQPRSRPAGLAMAARVKPNGHARPAQLERRP